MSSVYESAVRSKRAYEDPETTGEDMGEFISSSEDTQLYIKKDGDTIYVTFRGTSSIKDALVDLNISRYRIRENIKVHEGFFNQFKSVEIQITKRLVKDDDNVKRIIFAGHSLGGALAQIAAAYYGDVFDFAHVACHTFGSPRVGNSHFVEWFEKNVDENVRVANRKDPVPMIPTFHYWKHTSNKCIMMYDDGTIDTKPTDVPWYQRLYRLAASSKLSEHDCDLYVKRLSDATSIDVRNCTSAALPE